jgi:hypothetical protein
MKTLYYMVRWPLGFLMLILRNLSLRAVGWAMWWTGLSISLGLWFDQQGFELMPEKADPERLRKWEEEQAKKKNDIRRSD